VRAKVADLKAMERVLKETVARCAAGTGSHCPLIDALYRDGTAPPPRTPSVPRRSTRRSHRAGRGHA
jgi:MerR family mercuric resistance operon transcriptional regulator